MAPVFDSILFNKKAERKMLTLTLSENDGVLSAIKEGMQLHKVKEATVVEVNGKIKEGEMNFMERNKYKTMKLKDTPVFRASGSFKQNLDDLWGSMHISINQRNPTTGTLVRGKAAEGMEIKLSFFEEMK
jgi:predicted DNA-binding protein with PD1-like motif